MKVKFVGALVIVALVASACGSRTDESGTSEAGQVGGQTDSPVDTTPGETPGAPGDGEGFGLLESPCGPGDASGATDQGVTDDAITVGVIADPGSIVAGLNQELHDGMVAFAGWCNAQGGINGRTLELRLYDAQLAQYRDRVLEACDEVFALVGGGGVFDNLGAQEVVDCDLLEVPGFTVSPEKWATGVASGRMYSPIPNPDDVYRVGPARWYLEEFPEIADAGANTWGNAPVVDVQAANHQSAYESVGYEFVYQATTPIDGTVSDYSQYVVAMRDRNVEYFTFTSTWEELVNFQNAMAQQGFSPTVVDLEANFYNQEYASQGGSAVEGSFVRIGIAPFEEPDEVPAMADYLDAMERYNPSGKVATLGVHAFSAGLLFATATDAVGNDVTREAVIEQLRTIDDWSAGGLHAPNNPGENLPGPCFVIMEVVDGGFERRYPLPDDDAYEAEGTRRGYACPDDGVVSLD
jgi:ABC-type branched-subunit amino acid transport system substrate-binding protein